MIATQSYKKPHTKSFKNITPTPLHVTLVLYVLVMQMEMRVGVRLRLTMVPFLLGRFLGWCLGWGLWLGEPNMPAGWGCRLELLWVGLHHHVPVDVQLWVHAV